MEPVVVTGKELAARIGCRPSYIVELKRTGRLVPDPDGKGYLLAESMALYESTRDPSRAGVAARHAAARASAAAVAAPSASPATNGPQDVHEDDERPTGVAGGHADRRAKALADKEEALAAAAIRENRIALGELMQAQDVEAAVRQAGTLLRTALERIADVLAPQVAPISDEGRIHVMIHDAVEEAMTDASRRFAAIAQKESQ